MEPFHAKMVPGLRMTMGVGDWEKTFMLGDTDQDEFRHDLEHLVFHNETSLFLNAPPVLHKESGLYLDGNAREIVLRRVTEMPIIFMYIITPYRLEETTLGFCREKDVLDALCGVFHERYPKSSIGRPLKRHLKGLR